MADTTISQLGLGTPNTGGEGGSSLEGGSGIVIIRYVA